MSDKRKGMAKGPIVTRLQKDAAERHRRWAAYPALVNVLYGVRNRWQEVIEDEGCEVNGGDAVEWLCGELLPEIYAVLTEIGETK